MSLHSSFLSVYITSCLHHFHCLFLFLSGHNASSFFFSSFHLPSIILFFFRPSFLPFFLSSFLPFFLSFFLPFFPHSFSALFHKVTVLSRSLSLHHRCHLLQTDTSVACFNLSPLTHSHTHTHTHTHSFIHTNTHTNCQWETSAPLLYYSKEVMLWMWFTKNQSWCINTFRFSHTENRSWCINTFTFSQTGNQSWIGWIKTTGEMSQISRPISLSLSFSFSLLSFSPLSFSFLSFSPSFSIWDRRSAQTQLCFLSHTQTHT